MANYNRSKKNKKKTDRLTQYKALPSI